MPQRLTDVREVSILVNNLDTAGEVIFAHGLEDNAGTDLTPDMVVAELIDSDDYDDPAFFQYGVSRPDALRTRVWVRCDASAGGWTFNFRVTSAYLHSIQSADHSV